MHIEKFCFSELKKRVEEIELEVDKIEFISNEILRCRNTLMDIHNEIKKVSPDKITITLKVNDERNSLIELVNCNEDLNKAVKLDVIHLCREKVCEEYKEFLERAELLHVHYKQKT